jgi:hypothetical protein
MSLLPQTQTQTLVAVSDVLVVKALERVGAFLIRGARERYTQSRGIALHTLHTLWRAPDEITERALRGAWDVVPAMLDVHGCCGVTGAEVTDVLDDYVHDLVLTGTLHLLPELEYRFGTRLGLPVADRPIGIGFVEVRRA